MDALAPKDHKTKAMADAFKGFGINASKNNNQEIIINIFFIEMIITDIKE